MHKTTCLDNGAPLPYVGNGPAFAGMDGREEMDRHRIPALDPVQGRPVEGDAMVHQGGQALQGHGHQRRLGDDRPRTTTNRRCWPRPSPRSPASRSRTTSSRKATSSRRSRRRCSRARTSMTAGSTTPTSSARTWRYSQTVNLTDWMAGEGKDVTDPMLDVDDFIGKSFTTGPTASSTSCPTSSSPTSTGSATTGSPTRRYKAEVQGQVRLRPRRAGQLVGL